MPQPPAANTPKKAALIPQGVELEFRQDGTVAWKLVQEPEPNLEPSRPSDAALEAVRARKESHKSAELSPEAEAAVEKARKDREDQERAMRGGPREDDE